ncbi:AbrB/MazE/SpoVT family DNA-binding domain-containing protein [Bdellovibrio sp. HCB288]|uniref:AbrB/MazE/SpoVT family DNA-binding domain-containing protein n=1 Tax=Bdellovibrio sp. HCB288 TaxID=3394355 RepID=UPI0039B5AD5A
MSRSSATSKASRKNQTTIPQRVRKALGIAKGDTILWTIEGNEVSIKIINRVNVDWNKTSEMSLLEWAPAEEETKTQEEIAL